MTHRATAILVSTCAIGCTARCERPDVTEPVKLCVDEAPHEPCREAPQVESMLRDPSLEIVEYRATPEGRQKAQILTLGSRAGRFRAKWRALSTSHTLNDPRREIAAHAVQKLFLPPGALVFPPTTGHCFELAHYRARVNPAEPPSFPDTRCVFGTLGYWLEHALRLKELRRGTKLRPHIPFDEGMADENESYRRTLTDTNLLSYLIGHGDTHSGNFVVSGGVDRPHLYVVDATISFSSYRNPRIHPDDDWSTLHVPVLSARSVARLRALSREKLDTLATIEEYEIRNGLLVAVPPTMPTQQQDMGQRRIGQRLQLGLGGKEIDDLWQRITLLLQRVDRGELKTF